MSAPQGPNPLRFATAGLELLGILLVLIGLGYLADKHWGTRPWGVLTGAVIGIVGGLYRLIRDAMRDLPPTRTSRRDSDEDQP